LLSAPRPPLVGRVVVIDPGHNGGNAAHTAEINQLVDAVTEKKPCDTTGTATSDGYTESAYNFDVAQRLAGALRAQGAEVALTRQTDTGWGPCITERAAIANRAGAAVAISIHADGGPPAGRGFHVIEPALIAGYTDAIVGPSQRLGLDVRRRFQAATGMPFATYIGSQGLDTRSDLGGLNLSKVPKIFIETGNMANSIDAAQLEDPAFRARAAAGLAAALEDFLAGL
jgi:N-acetylmuramoyl-L-alanine amidase